jgi:drug/metabolite transporter (DMT)-like permease
MARGYLPLLLILAALWGASYLFIKVAVEEIDPAALVSYRLVIASIALLAILAIQIGWRRALDELRAARRPAIVLGVINGSVPFWLISWGETHIDSGIAAIGNCTVPIFTTLLAIRLHPGERSSGQRLVGIFVGLAGVGLLVGVHPEGGWWGALGTLAVVGSSACYAFSNLYAQTRFPSSTPTLIAAATIGAGAILMLPFGIAVAPSAMPGWKAAGSVLALALLGTVIAYLVHFRIITRYGSARGALVTYLLPVFALFYGAVLLDEPLRAPALGGLVMILAGVALGSGLARLPRRSTAP